jgi:hypothetical protein
MTPTPASGASTPTSREVLDCNTECKSAGQVISLCAADGYGSSDQDPVIVDVELGGRDADLCADGDASVSAAMMW